MRLRLLLSIAVCLLSALPAPAEDAPASAPETTVFVLVNEHGAEEWFRSRDGATIVRVEGGPYARRPYEGMGTTADAEPVEVASFFIDREEVTNARFAQFLRSVADVAGLVDADVPGLVRDAQGDWSAAPGLEHHPVTAATGLGAMAYATWVGGALPTPDQWMKAAGGPDGRVYPWGDAAPDASRANFAQPTARGPVAVGSYPAGASPYGCLDMAGNVYDRVLVPGRSRGSGGPAPEMLPAMLKGGSWVSPHPLNLRVLDLCMQPIEVADRSVGFRVVMADPEPDRPSRTVSAPPVLRLATDWDAAVSEARRRRVPLFLSLLLDTCGQCDRTRAQCYRDPRFVAYVNANLVMVVGHAPGDAMDEPHPEGEDGACTLYPGLTCDQHLQLYRRGVAVMGGFSVSPGNFVLDPERLDALDGTGSADGPSGVERGAGSRAVLIGERALPKWGNAVMEYIAAFERAREALSK